MNMRLNGQRIGTMQVSTVPSGTAWKTKLLRYAESHPEDVKVIAVNEDGSAFFHVPIAGIKCSPPRKVSEEQRVAARERFRQMWENKKIRMGLNR